MKTISTEMRLCIDQCRDCHGVCMQTLSHCLGMGGRHADVNHIQLMIDCVQICQISADFMLRGSEQHVHTCAACAEICQRCADDCLKFEDDQQMVICGDICGRCADLCRQMAHAHA